MLAPLTAVVAVAEGTGDSHSSSATTDLHGVSVVSEKSNSVHTDSNGAVEQNAEESTTIDPKGMNNKRVIVENQQRVDQKNGDFSDTAMVKRSDGTNEEESLKKETKSHWLDKGKTETTTHSVVVDPKGLGNKATSEVSKKVETNPDGSGSTTVIESANGKKVSESTVSHK